MLFRPIFVGAIYAEKHRFNVPEKRAQHNQITKNKTFNKLYPPLIYLYKTCCIFFAAKIRR